MESAYGRTGKRLALVIGAGGLKCLAALGLWKVLLRERIDIELFVGCSGGSMFASGMALNWDIDEGIKKSIRFAHTVFGPGSAGKRHWPSLLQTILPRVFKFDERFAMFDDQRVMENLEECFGDLTFADAKKALRIVAADLYTGDQVVLSEGKLMEAIRASICIPFLWTPWPMGDRLLVDGGLASPMPVDVAMKERADIILAMGFFDPPRRIESAAQFALQVLTSGGHNIFKAQFALHSIAHHSEIVHIFPEFERPIGLFEVDEIPYIIEAGEKAMETQLDYLARLLEKSS